MRCALMVMVAARCVYVCVVVTRWSSSVLLDRQRHRDDPPACFPGSDVDHRSGRCVGADHAMGCRQHTPGVLPRADTGTGEGGSDDWLCFRRTLIVPLYLKRWNSRLLVSHYRCCGMLSVVRVCRHHCPCHRHCAWLQRCLNGEPRERPSAGDVKREADALLESLSGSVDAFSSYMSH